MKNAHILFVKSPIWILPIAFRSKATALGEIKIENASAIQNTKTWVAPSSCEKSGAA